MSSTRINFGEDLDFIIHAFSSHEAIGWNTLFKYKKSIQNITLQYLAWLKLYLITVYALESAKHFQVHACFEKINQMKAANFWSNGS